MNIIIPKHSGFCYGVKRSVAVAYTLAGQENVYMYGQIVHNPSVVRDLQNSGLTLIQDLSEIPTGTKNAKILIRAHGVPPAVPEAAAARGFEIIDMTCPHVKKIHTLVTEASGRGLDVMVCGTPGHPETEGTLGRVETRAFLVQDLAEARRVAASTEFSPQGLCLVAQTTHKKQAYDEIRAFLAGQVDVPFAPHMTICEATASRQEELRALAKAADACIIVGGANSSNVTKLYEIARACCPRTQHIESVAQLDVSLLEKAETVVIAGGASTPEASVREVARKVSSVI
ncbi:MAG: 4-hydroxy-3-methylbut-2-enyl diphosphate reductase [Defluviitaleaceae bacterium]|nr:4-hydroxy-3-methylbut-2-enyl diphosphate reductase [Defluviitaleaceae bacterium]MCL2239500.1 4-hydroxy-3-methylbut-2-enyl diphosphate reductase [Defluviitaleaceae bacterium]